MNTNAADRARLLRANYREALMRGDKDPKKPMDEALDILENWENVIWPERSKYFYREVIHILSEPEEEIK